MVWYGMIWWNALFVRSRTCCQLGSTGTGTGTVPYGDSCPPLLFVYSFTGLLYSFIRFVSFRFIMVMYSMSHGKSWCGSSLISFLRAWDSHLPTLSNDHICCRPVQDHPDVLDLANNFHAVNHLSEGYVLPVEKAGYLWCYEELTTVRVWAGAVGLLGLASDGKGRGGWWKGNTLP